MSTLTEYKTRLDNINTTSISDGKSNILQDTFKALTTKYKLYSIAVIGILIGLYFMKPSFIKQKDVDGKVLEAINYKLLLKYWLIFSAVAIVGIYYYSNKKKEGCKMCGK